MALLYPGFLFALASILIPVIIHLVQIRKPKRILFTNVRFIKEVKNVTASQQKLKHLLILLSRILFLTFLVLLFCQPFIPASQENNNLAASGVSVYLDNSWSMQNESEAEGLTLLDQAVKDIQEVSGLFPASTQFRFLDNNLLPGININKDKLSDRANAVNFTAKAVDFSDVLHQVHRNEKQNIFIYSDFQKNTFNSRFFNNLDSASRYYLIPLKAAGIQNAFVDTIIVEDEFMRLEQNHKLTARIRNSGNETIEQCQVKLFVDNIQVSAMTLTLPPKQAANASFTFRLDSYGTKQCRIELEDYPVTFDNTYYFTLTPSRQILIQEIAETGGTPTEHLYTNEPVFQYSSSRFTNINYRTLAAANLVVLQSVREIDGGMTDNLKRFVQDGGHLVVIPAAEANKDSYAVFFRALGLNQISWLGSPAESRPLAVPDIRNPFFKNIFEDIDRNMQMPQARQVLKWNRSAADILRYRQGGNFLSAFGSGKGRVYVYASALVPDHSDFTSHGIFVPVMYKIAMNSYQAIQLPAYTLDGSPVSIPVKQSDHRKTVFKLEMDSLTFIPDQRISENRLVFSPPAEMTVSGFYKLKHQDSVMATLAFNYDRRESELDQYSKQELREMIGPDRKNVSVYELEGKRGTKEQFQKDNFGVPLWKYCLILCLAFLMIEILLIRFYKA